MSSFSTKILTVLSVLLCIGITAGAQQTYDMDGLTDPTGFWELNISSGGNNFLGDLGGTQGKGRPLLKDYTVNTNKMLAGISVSYNMNNWSQFNVGINFSKINDADSLINNGGGFERWRYYRNLSFRSNITEVYADYTFYPLMYIDRKRIELRRVAPFITAGIGAFHFRSQAQLNNKWIDLQPLSLEGQGFAEYPDRKPYKLTQIYIPLNIGVKYYLDNTWALSTGAFMRKTFTDYIDDISTTYIDPALFYKYFSPEKAAIASQLYSRSRRPEKVKPGIEKADHTNKDSYITFFITLSIKLHPRIPFYYPNIPHR